MELGATNVVALLSPGVYLFVGFERKTETEEDLHTRRREEKKKKQKRNEEIWKEEKETGKRETDKKERVVTFLCVTRQRKTEVCPCMNGINQRTAMHYIYTSLRLGLKAQSRVEIGRVQTGGAVECVTYRWAFFIFSRK